MKKLIAFVAVALLGALPAFADDVVRSFDRQFSAANASRIQIDVPVGELHVDASAGRRVDVHVSLECDTLRKSRCTELAKGIDVVATSSGNRLKVELKGWPRSSNRGLEANVRVTVPVDLTLDVDLGVGELRVKGLEADLTADLGVGEVTVIMPADAVGEVSVDTGVGEATLHADGRHWEGKGFVGQALNWSKGRGKAEVNVDCGVGEAEIRLE